MGAIIRSNQVVFFHFLVQVFRHFLLHTKRNVCECSQSAVTLLQTILLQIIYCSCGISHTVKVAAEEILMHGACWCGSSNVYMFNVYVVGSIPTSLNGISDFFFKFLPIMS